MNFATTLDEVLYLRSENERLQDVKRRSLAIADERAIEAVKARAENEKLRAALKPFAALDTRNVTGYIDVKVYDPDIRAAKAALGDQQATDGKA